MGLVQAWLEWLAAAVADYRQVGAVDVVALLVCVAVVGAVAAGMLVAPRLEHWQEEQ